MPLDKAFTTPEGCPIVEAITQVHYQLATTAQMSTSSEEELIGEMFIGSESATWYAKCSTCLGDITVRHFFSDPGFGQHATVRLPMNCPSKPVPEDSPTLFFEFKEI